MKSGKTQNGIATGSVHVTVRDQIYDETVKKIVNKQTIRVDCDRAVYTVGKEQGQGSIDLSGNILSKTYRPGEFAGPASITAETGSIIFLSKTKTSLILRNGSATVIPIEPTPAPTKKP